VLLTTGNSHQRRRKQAHPADSHHFPSIERILARRHGSLVAVVPT
jgi:hypothetical protein